MKIPFYLPLLFILAGVWLLGCQTPPDEKKSQPNIVIIVADDLGWNDVGYHDSDIRTPHIDDFVKQGMELDRFYAAPICSPTRAGLMTGNYPDRYGIRHGVVSPRVIGGLPPEATTIAEMLRDAGYSNRAAFGKWHLGHSDKKYHPMNQGFTSFYGHYNGAIDYFTHSRNGTLDWHEDYSPNLDTGYSTELLAKKAAQFIQSQEEDKPFFAYVAFNGPHSPMQAMAKQLKAYGYDPSTPSEPFPVGGAQKNEYNLEDYGERGRGNDLRQTFSAMVSSLDDGIGLILQSLQENRLEKNTIVWFLSDNGGTGVFGGNNEPLRGGKHTEWEGGVRVVSAVRWPDHIVAGSKSDQLMAYVDILPTLHHVAGDSGKVETDGIDMTAALLGEKKNRGYVFLGNGSLVSQKWKLKDSLLFEIENDPNEKENVADSHPEKIKAMQQALDSITQVVDKRIELEKHAPDWRPAENWSYE